MSRSRSIQIIALAWLAYVFSYLGRADYGANMLHIVQEIGISRGAAGMVSSTLSICNATGQLASAFAMRKLDPRKLIWAELLTVALINLLFPFVGSFALMVLLWGINGAIQSTLLCSATKIYVETLEEPYLSYGATMMNTVGAVGGAMIYLMTWALVPQIGWRGMFLLISALLFGLSVVWLLTMGRMKAEKTEIRLPERELREPPPAACPPLSKRIFQHGALYVVLGIFAIGMLRESVLLWLPTYLNEVFGFSRDQSTLLTVFVPLLQVSGPVIATWVSRRCHGLHLPGGIAFLISGVCLLFLRLLGNINAILTIGLFVIHAISMTTALTFFLSLYPIRFFGKVQAVTLTGLLNFFSHAGDFVASTGIGWVSEHFGWDRTLLILCVVALVSAAICAVGAWQSKRR